MSEKIKYLYDNQNIANVLAEGFAKICNQKPKFPVNFLARYLKNHTIKNNQKQSLIDRLQSNVRISKKMLEQQAQLKSEMLKKLEIQNSKNAEIEKFLSKISQTKHHEQKLDYFCEWVTQKLGLTGVYIGELEYQMKKINPVEEDGDEAHLELEKQKIVKFKFASENQKNIVVGKILSQESVVGKLLNKAPTDEPPAQEENNQNEQGENKPRVEGEIYFPSVVGNQQLKFFRFPKLGAYFASCLPIKSYLNEKFFDQNTIKVENYRKILQEFEKQLEEKQHKFKQTYEDRVHAGAEQKQLQDLEKEFERQKSQMSQPVQQYYSFHERKFVICADTLGLDRQITQNEKQQLRKYILHLKQSWEEEQKRQLEQDIELQLSLTEHSHEQGHDGEIPNYQEQYTSLLQEEEKEMSSHQEVDRAKDNSKLYELECNTVRIQKIKEYMSEDKYIKFWNHILQLNILKYHQILKQFLILLGFKKQQFCFPGTNLLDWLKTKSLLKAQSTLVFQRVNAINPRGSKPQVVLPYAKCSRIAKNIEGLDPLAISSYNIYLSFILRLLQLYTKTRVLDRNARVTRIQQERQLREQKLRQAEEKSNEKKQKLQTLKAELQQKGELQTFDQEIWNIQYDEENPPVQIPDEIVSEYDRDLDDIPDEVIAE